MSAPLWSSAVVALPWALGCTQLQLLMPEHSPASLPERAGARLGVGVGINPWRCNGGALGGGHPSSAPRTGLNWEGAMWAAGKEPPAQCSPHRHAARCCPAVAGASVERSRCWRALEELVIGRKTWPFTHNYSSPLEPFHLLSVVTPVGLLSLPSHPTEP